MKVVILAGGFGTRLAEETDTLPKPMVEVGGKPLLWHIMRHYSHYGHKEFFVALGYKGDVIKRYFNDQLRIDGDLTIDLAEGTVHVNNNKAADWVIHLVDTGLTTNTGGRVGRLAAALGSDQFMVTYGDGVADVNLDELLKYHQSQKVMATVTAVRPPSRFGGLTFNGSHVTQFIEKPQIGEGWINGGFMVLEPTVFKHLQDDGTSLETDLLSRLASVRQLAGYRHTGFWHCMDTVRDRRMLEQLWADDNPPWKIWND